MLRLSDDECSALLDILFDNSITGLALVNEDGTFRRVNRSFCSLTEYSEAELRKMTFQQITDPADVKADEEMAALVAKGEYTGYDMVKSYICKTRRIQQVLLRVTGLRIGGRFTFFVGEVAPMDSPPAERAIDSAVHAAAARRLLLKAVKEYWHIIALVLSAVSVIISQVIERLHPA